MKIFEMFSVNSSGSKLDFDLDDDLIFFMNNDPDFYRKEYYPFLNRFKHYCDQGKTPSPKAFKSIIVRAYESYKEAYDINELDESLDGPKLRDICEKLCDQEMKNYHEEKGKKK